MKIVYLTAGAGGMFCGSCIHDNALAKELIQLGHECLLVPVYTPIRTDDEDVSADQVFMGGLMSTFNRKCHGWRTCHVGLTAFLILRP